MISLYEDAFSHSQVSSKIWLCENIEYLKSQKTAIYGGWYGVTAFLLLSRNKFQVERIESYDADPHCENIADTINECWVYQNWKFKAHTFDCNLLVSDADLIINTSTEHFDSKDWWDNIQSGTRVALQSNNMPHEEHSHCTSSLEEFKREYCLSEVFYEGEKKFEYPDKSFSRYMLIGVK